jgi:hypothetical protein
MLIGHEILIFHMLIKLLSTSQLLFKMTNETNHQLPRLTFINYVHSETVLNLK